MLNNSFSRNRLSVAGLPISNQKKSEILDLIVDRIKSGKKTFIITPYSEFLHRVLNDKSFKQICETSDIAIADGIAIIWASYFLEQKFTVSNYYAKIVEAFFQAISSLSLIIFNQKKLYKYIPEKIAGSDFFWDLADLAEQNNLSIFLLGGYGLTPEKVSIELKRKNPNIKIAGYSNKDGDDAEVVNIIKKVKPDILMVAYGPFKQEQWISKHLDQLPVKLVIGLGGTFDYVAGLSKSPSDFIRKYGFEWLFRLITQPKRFFRIYNGTINLIKSLIRYKVFMSLPLRPNVAVVVFDQSNRVLLCKRKKIGTDQIAENRFSDYWQFPQGGIDQGEDIYITAKRELAEETGIATGEILSCSSEEFSYDWTHGPRYLTGNPLKFRGQKQKLCYFKFTGNYNEIKLDNNEFVDYKWVDFAALEKSIHEERKDLVKILKKDYPKGIL